MKVIKAYPLQYPVGWKRTDSWKRKYGRFKSGTGYTATMTIATGTQRILDSLSKMGIHRDDCVISSNLLLRLDGFPRSDQKKPDDPGVAVYWLDKKESRCMAIDTYTTVEQNLAAIAATLEAMRAIERHGGAEILNRAFTGFNALPENTQSVPAWRDVLKLKGDVSIEDVRLTYRSLAKVHHPDAGGDAGAFAVLTRAYEMALKELA